MSTHFSLHRLLARAALLLLAACASAGPSPGSPYDFVRCPAGHPALAEAYVHGGRDSLLVRGHKLVLPEGAVRSRTRFRVRDRHTGYAGVDVEPHGLRLDRPARLTLSYAGCTPPAPGARLSIVHVRHGTTEVLGDPLPSEVDTVARTVTADVSDFSGYLIGSN